MTRDDRPDDAPALVRAARPEDGAALARLDASQWPLELQVAPPAAADADFFTPGRTVDDVLVADRDGVVVGLVHLARHSGMAVNAHVVHVNAVLVAASERGRGTGAALTRAAIDEARRRGYRKVGLRVLSTNPRAIALYERLGFVQEGRLRQEFLLADGAYADDLWYGLSLVEAG